MSLKDWLETIAALVVVLGVPVIAWRPGKEWWERTWGARRAQSRLLDRLAHGEPIERVNQWLGLPVHTKGEAHVYELRGAWVQIIEREGAVESFAITIADRRYWYDAGLLTGGFLNVQLGRSSFVGSDGYYWMGARREGYVTGGMGGNPSEYQGYYLAFNDAGCGYLGASDDGVHLRNPADTTINTLMVTGPFVDIGDVRERFGVGSSVGVDLDDIRIRRRPADRPGPFRAWRWWASRWAHSRARLVVERVRRLRK